MSEEANLHAGAFERSHSIVLSNSLGYRGYRPIISIQQRHFLDEQSVPLILTATTRRRTNSKYRQTLNPGSLTRRARCQQLMRPPLGSIPQPAGTRQCLRVL